MSNPEQNIKFLQDQLAWATARKLTPASKRSRDPAQIIDASTPSHDFRGGSITMAFKLAMKPQMQWFQNQPLIYKSSCPCCKRRNAITVEATYVKTDAVFPDSYPTRCETCQGGEA